jgi:transcription antitermination factor NusG
MSTQHVTRMAKLSLYGSPSQVIASSDMDVRAAWYALRVRARAEHLIAAALAARQVEHFLPCWEERRDYSDRVRRVPVAAFPGYLFCRIALADRFRILNASGVQYLVGRERIPEPIEDTVISSLQTAFSRTGRASLIAYLQTGDLVRVLDGPMAGATGILLRSKGQQRLVISVTILQRSVAVEVDGASVMLLESSGKSSLHANVSGLP